MTNLIKIGPEITADLSKLIDSKLLIQANSGGGKSWAIRRILEQSHGKVQHIILDPEGEFATLREKYEYILCGKNQDAPAEPRSAALLAHRLLEANTSVIIDLYELHPQDRKRFVRLFLEAMINAPKELWHPCLVVIDEAHTFAPEKGESEALNAVIGLASLGRKRGFGAILATQRISKLHKDAAAECNNKLIGRTGLDIDRKRAAEEIGFTSKEDVLSLRMLNPGEFYAFGPAISSDVIRGQVGNIKTSHPTAGARTLTKVFPPTDKIKKILAKLADLPQEARREAETIQSLKQEIATLKRSHTVKEADPAMIERAVKTAVMAKEREYDSERQQMIIQTGNFLKIIQGIGKIVGPYIDNKITVGQYPKIDSGRFPITISPHVPRAYTAVPKASDNPFFIAGFSGNEGEVKIQGGALRMLKVLTSRYPMEFTRSQLATFAKLSPNSGTYTTYLSNLKNSGMIEVNGDLLKASTTGLEFIGDNPTPPQTSEEVIEMWKNNLQGGARRMFEVLIQAYPGSLSRDQIGEESSLSPASGTFTTYLSMLQSNGLIEKKDGFIKVSDNLFL